MSTMRYQKDLPLRLTTDVLVVGGGPAGCAAAWAAAKTGKKVFLAESQACLGGLGTAGMVPAFMQFGDGEHFLAGGYGELLFERLKAMGEAVGEPQRAYEIRAENLKRVYEEMLIEQGVSFTFHTQLIDVLAQDGRIEAAVFAAKSGVFAIQAQVYIDATGDGDLCAWAGAPYEKGDEEGNMMAGTLCQLWANIDWQKVDLRDDSQIDAAFEAGVFKVLDKHLPGMWRVSLDGGIGGGNIGHAYGVDGTDERSLTQALIYSRRLMDQYRAYYKNYLHGFEKMELVATGSLMGIRESRRIMGIEKLILPHFHEQACFPNEIGRYAYPVDAHAAKPTAQAYEKFRNEHTNLRYKKGESYGIPYGILVPQKLSNALVCGRCVSTDREMQSSIRVMPGCYITGQAAGVGAALSIIQNVAPAQVEVPALQQSLRALGAYLPEHYEKPARDEVTA